MCNSVPPVFERYKSVRVLIVMINTLPCLQILHICIYNPEKFKLVFFSAGIISTKELTFPSGFGVLLLRASVPYSWTKILAKKIQQQSINMKSHSLDPSKVFLIFRFHKVFQKNVSPCFHALPLVLRLSLHLF